MLRGFLIDEKTGQRAELRTKLVVGRTRECDFPIDDSAASRKHIEVSARGDRYIWKDLGSTNGTVINGNRMLAGELQDGDQILIGETSIRFELQDVPELPVEARETGSLFRESIIDTAGQVVQAEETGGSDTELLEAVYTVMNEIANTYEPCELMDRMLEAVARTADAQRAAIFLSPDGAKLIGCPVCGKVHHIKEGKLQAVEPDAIRISSTVAERVLREGESVLFQTAGQDAELDASASIMSLDLRSIVCAPLRSKSGILGILYFDSDREHQAYTHTDMLLASALGNSAGLALENAAMHREILEKQRMEQEIETAWTIQEGFLVKDWPEDDPRFEVYGETRPAKTVGGDFFDFVRPAKDTAGILIGDVSGKGVPASLTMAQLLAEFRLHARDLESPAAVLRALNADLSVRSQRGMFCTMCYIRIDLRTGAAVCANAGHSPALLAGSDGTTLFGEATGPPAGILPDGPWVDETLTIAPGGTVLLYTDGIVEAHGVSTRVMDEPAPEQFETERLGEVAARHCGCTPKELVAAVNADVHAFCEPALPHDDCTMIAFRYLGHAG